MIYLQKYSKYKSRYFKSKKKYIGGLIDDPDLVDFDDEFILAEPESEFPENTVTDEDLDELVKSETDREQNTELLGYNNTLVTQDQISDQIKISEDISEEDIGETTVIDRLENTLAEGLTYVDIGIFGKTRGKIFRFEYFDNFPEDLFINTLAPDKTKILTINNKNLFDEFTDKYGYIYGKKKAPRISRFVISTGTKWPGISVGFIYYLRPCPTGKYLSPIKIIPSKTGSPMIIISWTGL